MDKQIATEIMERLNSCFIGQPFKLDKGHVTLDLKNFKETIFQIDIMNILRIIKSYDEISVLIKNEQIIIHTFGDYRE